MSQKRSLYLVAICCTVILLTSCRSGTWENDAGNWRRAFGTEPPTEITVINSWYWRSAHFTTEFECFFEFTATDKFVQELVEFNRLEMLDTVPEARNIHSYFHTKPAWFVPNELDGYEIYVVRGDEFSLFKMFIDLETNHIFLTEFQV